MILRFETMTPSPYFSQVFILKGVKVLCFDTLLQVFILKVLICTKIVQSQGIWKRTATGRSKGNRAACVDPRDADPNNAECTTWLCRCQAKSALRFRWPF